MKKRGKRKAVFGNARQALMLVGVVVGLVILALFFVTLNQTMSLSEYRNEKYGISWVVSKEWTNRELNSLRDVIGVYMPSNTPAVGHPCDIVVRVYDNFDHSSFESFLAERFSPSFSCDEMIDVDHTPGCYLTGRIAYVPHHDFVVYISAPNLNRAEFDSFLNGVELSKPLLSEQDYEEERTGTVIKNYECGYTINLPDDWQYEDQPGLSSICNDGQAMKFVPPNRSNYFDGIYLTVLKEDVTAPDKNKGDHDLIARFVSYFNYYAFNERIAANNPSIREMNVLGYPAVNYKGNRVVIFKEGFLYDLGASTRLKDTNIEAAYLNQILDNFGFL